MKSISLTGILTACVAVLLSMSATASADPLACNLAAYKASPGMTATVDGTALTLTRDGARALTRPAATAPEVNFYVTCWRCG